MAVSAAFPFVTVDIINPPPPTAQRAPGVIAVVGKTPAGTNGGTVPANTPTVVETTSDAASFFAKVTAGVTTPTSLYTSLVLAMNQTPKPSKIYGVRVDGDNYAAALSSIEAIDDITFVALASEVDVAKLKLLKDHIESVSSNGLRRIGVAMIDPTRAKSNTYAADVETALTTAPNDLRSSVGRMIMVAARGATEDVAVAAMSSIAGYAPQVSVVLKAINGVTMPKGGQYSPTEIKALGEKGIIPIIDPTLIVGESLHFGDGQTFTTNATFAYVDYVRVIDDIEFRMKAGLIGAIGDSRITKEGMTSLKIRIDGILGPLKRAAVLDDYLIEIPVLDILSMPESARSTTDSSILTTARQNRVVDVNVTVTYGPAVHRLGVRLAVKY